MDVNNKMGDTKDTQRKSSNLRLTISTDMNLS